MLKSGERTTCTIQYWERSLPSAGLSQISSTRAHCVQFRGHRWQSRKNRRGTSLVLWWFLCAEIDAEMQKRTLQNPQWIKSVITIQRTSSKVQAQQMQKKTRSDVQKRMYSFLGSRPVVQMLSCCRKSPSEEKKDSCIVQNIRERSEQIRASRTVASHRAHLGGGSSTSTSDDNRCAHLRPVVAFMVPRMDATQHDLVTNTRQKLSHKGNPNSSSFLSSFTSWRAPCEEIAVASNRSAFERTHLQLPLSKLGAVIDTRRAQLETQHHKRERPEKLCVFFLSYFPGKFNAWTVLSLLGLCHVKSECLFQL